MQISNWAHTDQDKNLIKNDSRIKIAFIIPSKNGPNDKPENVHLVQSFLTSLIKSINSNEWNEFIYSVYVGYDLDDPIIDKRRDELVTVLDNILGPRRKDVLFKFHLLPTVKCVTMLWNILFIDAVNDGNQYFYQLNDDVTLLSKGWTTEFVKRLSANDGIGVVGPNDLMWNCRLFTQSFVSRIHYEIFHWYFPTQIKDWYSDNWITQVYGTENTFCASNHGIRNGASKTRYNICSKPRWQEQVQIGQATIAEWNSTRLKKLATKLTEADKEEK